MTLISSVLKHAASSPKKISIASGEDRVTYQYLKNRILIYADALKKMGVERGDRVLICSNNNPSFVYAYYATHLLNGISVPVDSQISGTNLNYISETISPKLVIGSWKSDNGIAINAPFEEINKNITELADYNMPLPSDDADILFTTGATGKPKGVLLTQKNILAQAVNITSFIGNGYDDSEIVPLPLSHSFGLGRLRSVSLTGGTIILVDGFLFPGKILNALQAWKATGISLVPAGFNILFRLFGNILEKFADQLKYIEIGSSAMPLENKKRIMSLLPHTRICMHYGLTEASRAAFIEFNESKNKLESIGKPSPNVMIKIVNEHNQEVQTGEPGEIMVSGGMAMKGYWKENDLTEQTIEDGWVHTGDIGYKDKDGYLFLKGRQKDIINVAGLKVSPLEIEAILNTHRSIKESACVEIPDPRGISGEAVKAFLVQKNNQKPDNTELVDYLRGKIEDYKIPSVFEWIKELPRTSNGKIQRYMLKN